MTMLKKFKAFFNKNDFDYSEGLVDPFKFHKLFFKVLVAFKVADIEYKHKPKLLNQNAVLFTTGLTAIIMVLISLYHGLNTFDIPHITETGTYALVLFYKLMILYSTKQNLPQYYNLQRAIKKDFYYICTEGTKYRAPLCLITLFHTCYILVEPFTVLITNVSHTLRHKFFENQVLTWKISTFACFFPIGIGIGMAIFAIFSLLFFLAIHKEGDGSTRPLLFPFWLPNVDFGQTPYYEIAFVFANVCVVLYAYNYVFMIQTQIVWIRQITSKVDIIIWRIQDLLEGIHPATSEEEFKYFSNLIIMRMRTIVIHHQAMLSLVHDYAIVYKKMLLYEQQFCGPVVCLTAYCTAEKLNEGEFQLILPLLFVATIVLHFIPSYYCTYLAEKARSICDACWEIPFWNATPAIRPYMILIMQRSLRPLPLYAPGFQPISLQTFSNKMTSAYSFFNMLRQTQH